VSTSRWTRLELFGHRVLYGLVTEVERYGEKFAEVKIPCSTPKLVNGVEQFEIVSYYAPKAIYSETEVGEETVRKALEPWTPAQRPALPAAIAFPAIDEDEDNGRSPESDSDPDSWETSAPERVNNAASPSEDDIPM
jgi:hypothetical protein